MLERWVPILPIIRPAVSIGGPLSGVLIVAFSAERVRCEQALLWVAWTTDVLKLASSTYENGWGGAVLSKEEDHVSAVSALCVLNLLFPG